MSNYGASHSGHPSDDKTGSFFGVLRGCFIALLAVFMIGMLALVAVVGFFMVGTAMRAASPRDMEPVRLREIRLSGPVDAPKIAVINVDGLIYGSSIPSGQLSPVSIISAKLMRARRDPQVRGVLLAVDSAGGGITGSDILHNYLKKMREEPGAKPVVASILNIGASGAYYGICGVDKIIAHPTSLTGSIGVIMPLYDATGLMRKIGIREESILSGEHKDIASPFSDRPDEIKRRQRELLEDIVESMHGRFVETVANSRGLEPEAVSAMADGRIMTARDALEAGLIDEIGYEDEAIEALRKMADVDVPQLVQYRRELSFGDFLTLLLVRARGMNLDILPFFVNSRPLQPLPMYLWTGEEMGWQE